MRLGIVIPLAWILFLVLGNAFLRGLSWWEGRKESSPSSKMTRKKQRFSRREMRQAQQRIKDEFGFNLSREAAVQAWLDLSAITERDLKVILDFEQIMRTFPKEGGSNLLRPTWILPHAKESIEKALISAFKISRSDAFRRHLKARLWILQSFVPDKEIPLNPRENSQAFWRRLRPDSPHMQKYDEAIGVPQIRSEPDRREANKVNASDRNKYQGGKNPDHR